MTKLQNLTPHPINIGGLQIPPSGKVARVDMDRRPFTQVEAEGKIIWVDAVEYGEVQDLPDPQEDVLYIVSALVRQARPERADLTSPGRLIRSATGDIVGAECLDVSGSDALALRWISVGERLPGANDRVSMVTLQKAGRRTVRQGVWYSQTEFAWIVGEGFFAEKVLESTVVAWLPAPRPFQGGTFS